MNLLPEEIRGLICLNLDIKTIENLYACYEQDLLPCQIFWNNYFSLYNLNIIQKRNNTFNWINEFKIADIMHNLNKLDIIPCIFMYARGPIGERCNIIPEPGNNMCSKHIYVLNPSKTLPKTKEIIIEYNMSASDISNFEKLFGPSEQQDCNVTVLLTTKFININFRGIITKINIDLQITLYYYLNNLLNNYRLKFIYNAT